VVIHEAPAETDGPRRYLHRFASLDAYGRLTGVSRPFHFGRLGVEFAAGLAWMVPGERLVVSYGVEDRQAWLATLDAADVRAALAPTG
jgi:hypothetical protein